MPPAIVSGPSLAAPRFGLLASAIDGAARNPGGRWTQGLAWEPETCGSGGIVSLCDDEVEKTLEDDNPGAAAFQPFAVWEGYRCSTFGPDGPERERRARALLEVHQSHHVEAAFWRGDYVDGSVDDVAAYADNDWLANPDMVEDLSPGGSSPGVYALAALEEAIGGCGGRVMIHVPIPVATFWFANQAIRREGNLLLTALDNIVVPGSGYDGSDANGDIDETGETAWAYATGMVEKYLGEVRTYGVTPESGIDRRQNSWETRAERLVALAVDPCCRFGINVNLCSPFCDPS